jgi:hypothetical protein
VLALSDIQDVACLRFDREEVGLECAGRILEIVNVVKRQPVALLCLLTGILAIRYVFNTRQQVLILEAIKQAIPFIDDESATTFLLPLASSLRGIQSVPGDSEPHIEATVTAEAQRIHSLLQAKYAASSISSIAQLRLLSCARLAAVTQPAMGWLRMHEPL